MCNFTFKAQTSEYDFHFTEGGVIRLGFNFDLLSLMERCYLVKVYFPGCKPNLRTCHYCLLTIALTEMVIGKEHCPISSSFTNG